MQFLWKYIGELIGKGLEWYIILEFILYSIPYLIPRALPLAVLLSSIMTYGNLGERYELVAIKSSGVSLLKTMRPMFLLMMGISAIAFYSSNVLIPRANLSWGALFYDVTNKKPAMNLQDGIFFKDLQGYAIKVGHKHKDNQTLDDILIYARTPNGKGTTIIIAKRGKMEITENKKYMKLNLIDGVRYEEMTENPQYEKRFQHNKMSFSEYDMAIDLSELELKRSSPELFKDNYEMLNISELRVRIDSLEIVIGERKEFLKSYLEAYYHFNHDSDWVEKKYDLSKIKTDGSGYFGLIERSYSRYNAGENPEVDSDTDHIEEQAYSIDSSSDLGGQIVSIGAKGDSTYGPVITSSIVGSKANHHKSRTPPERQLSTSSLIENAIQSSRNMHRITESTRIEIRQLSERMRRYDIQWHKKFTLAFSCLLLFFVGAPMGAIIRKGGFGAPLIAAILMFIVYFIMQTVGEKLAREGVLEVWAGAWFSSLFFVPLALFLTYKASTDSALFDREAYVRMFRRISRLFKKSA